MAAASPARPAPYHRSRSVLDFGKEGRIRQDTARQAEAFSQLLVEHDYELTRALVQAVCAADVSQQEPILTAVLAILTARGAFMDFIKMQIEMEIESTVSEGTLFREGSTASRLMSQFFVFKGASFLASIVGDVIAKANALTQSLDIDASQVDESIAQNNLATLQGWATQVLDGLRAHVVDCPAEFRNMLAYAEQLIVGKFPTMKCKATGGFLFLRFICPALINPSRYGITAPTPTPTTSTTPPPGDAPRPINVHGSRALVTLSKVLQKLANGQLFADDQPRMALVNPFLKDHMDDVASVLTLYSTRATKQSRVSVFRSQATRTMSPDEVRDHVKTVKGFIVQNVKDVHSGISNPDLSTRMLDLLRIPYVDADEALLSPRTRSPSEGSKPSSHKRGASAESLRVIITSPASPPPEESHVPTATITRRGSEPSKRITKLEASVSELEERVRSAEWQCRQKDQLIAELMRATKTLIVRHLEAGLPESDLHAAGGRKSFAALVGLTTEAVARYAPKRSHRLVASNDSTPVLQQNSARAGNGSGARTVERSSSLPTVTDTDATLTSSVGFRLAASPLDGDHAALAERGERGSATPSPPPLLHSDPSSMRTDAVDELVWLHVLTHTDIVVDRKRADKERRKGRRRNQRTRNLSRVHQSSSTILESNELSSSFQALLPPLALSSSSGTGGSASSGPSPSRKRWRLSIRRPSSGRASQPLSPSGASSPNGGGFGSGRRKKHSSLEEHESSALSLSGGRPKSADMSRSTIRTLFQPQDGLEEHPDVPPLDTSSCESSETPLPAIPGSGVAFDDGGDNAEADELAGGLQLTKGGKVRIRSSPHIKTTSSFLSAQLLAHDLRRSSQEHSESGPESPRSVHISASTLEAVQRRLMALDRSSSVDEDATPGEQTPVGADDDEDDQASEPQPPTPEDSEDTPPLTPKVRKRSASYSVTSEPAEPVEPVFGDIPVHADSSSGLPPAPASMEATPRRKGSFFRRFHRVRSKGKEKGDRSTDGEAGDDKKGKKKDGRRGKKDAKKRGSKGGDGGGDGGEAQGDAVQRKGSGEKGRRKGSDEKVRRRKGSSEKAQGRKGSDEKGQRRKGSSEKVRRKFSSLRFRSTKVRRPASDPVIPPEPEPTKHLTFQDELPLDSGASESSNSDDDDGASKYKDAAKKLTDTSLALPRIFIPPSPGSEETEETTNSELSAVSPKMGEMRYRKGTLQQLMESGGPISVAETGSLAWGHVVHRDDDYDDDDDDEEEEDEE